MFERIVLAVIVGILAFVWVWGYQYFSEPEFRAVYMVTSFLTVCRMKCGHEIKSKAQEGGQ